MASVLNNIAKRLNAQAKNLMKTNVFYSTSSFESAASHAAATTQFGAEYNPDVVQTAATNFMHSLSDMNSLETHFMKLARNYILESNKKKWICIEKQGNDAKASLEGRNVNVEQVRSIKKMIKQPHSQSNHGAVIELILTKDGNTLPGLMYEGSLSPSTYVFQGLGVIRTGDRNYYKGEFQHGTFNGKGVRIIAGDKFQGTFVNGKLHGYGMVYFKDGTILQGQFVNGMLDGTVSIQLSSGMTLELRFRKGETNLEQECLKMYREDLEYNLRSLKRAAAPELMHLKV